MTVLRCKFARVRLAVAFLAASLLPASALHAKDFSELMVVVKDAEGKPVARASVVLSKLKGKNHDKVKGRPMQIKTSLQGTAPLPPLEQGFYMLQVISDGYQTHGDTIELSEAEQTHEVTLEPPQDQFSVHTDGKK